MGPGTVVVQTHTCLPKMAVPDPHVRIRLVCRRGTPVADMLTNSPPLPLIIDHIHDNDSMTAEDEAAIMLALQHRDRVRRIRLKMPLSILQELALAMDEEFPMLEYLYMTPSVCNPWFTLPNTFQAPRLRHLILTDFAFPMTSPLIKTNQQYWPRLTLASTHPSICVLAPKRPTPTNLTYTSARDTRDQFSLHYSQP